MSISVYLSFVKQKLHISLFALSIDYKTTKIYYRQDFMKDIFNESYEEQQDIQDHSHIHAKHNRQDFILELLASLDAMTHCL